MFEKMFSDESEYFAPFSLSFNQKKLRSFFATNDDKRVFLTHLFFYVESLVCVQEKIGAQVEFTKKGSSAPLYADKIWYAAILMIILSIIDKSVSTSNSNKCNKCGRAENKSLSSFRRVMGRLKSPERSVFISRYKEGCFGTFDEIVKDIYGDRNVFAHDVTNLSTSSYLGLSHEIKPDGVYMKLNLKHQEIFLYIIIGLMREWGFRGQMYVRAPEIKSFADLI